MLYALLFPPRFPSLPFRLFLSPPPPLPLSLPSPSFYGLVCFIDACSFLTFNFHETFAVNITALSFLIYMSLGDHI